MHSPEKVHAFFDLRSKGNCLAYISREINVPTSTLSDWNRRYALDIEDCRACKWESAEQAIQFNPEADLIRITQRIRALEHELDRRPIERMTVSELVRVLSLWRREYFRRRNRLLASIEHPKPNPEISEKIPVWDSHPVADEVTRRPTSQAPSANKPAPTADAAQDLQPQPTTQAKPESKPEKTGIPISEAGGLRAADGSSHFPTFAPAHLPSGPPLFSLESHLPIPTDQWLPTNTADLLIYPSQRAAISNNSVPEKTMIASTA